jgi:DNA-binding NarL/FixJ family response regulator
MVTESKTKKRRVFVVDDHSVLREGLRSVINQQSDLLVCGEAAEAAEALAKIPFARPDVVLVDLSLAHSSGLELLKDLVIQHPSVWAIVLSMHDEMIYAHRVLRAGARGYLMKTESSQSLLLAIRQVLAGKVFVSDNVMTAIAAKLGEHKGNLLPIERLSDRELEVFELMGQGMSTPEIAKQMNLSIKTVQSYVVRAKGKFGVASFTGLLREAFRWERTFK